MSPQDTWTAHMWEAECRVDPIENMVHLERSDRRLIKVVEGSAQLRLTEQRTRVKSKVQFTLHVCSHIALSVSYSDTAWCIQMFWKGSCEL